MNQAPGAIQVLFLCVDGFVLARNRSTTAIALNGLNLALLIKG